MRNSVKNLDILFILRFYDALLRAPSISDAARVLNVSTKVLQRKMHDTPELKVAQDLAEKNRKLEGEALTIGEYVLERLSPEARKAWTEIQFWEGNYERIDAMLDGKGKRIRQELFIHALCTSCFDVAHACRMVGVSRNMIEQWKTDIGFMTLLEDVQWHKKNFFESALLDLVEQRHPGAVMFVNRTQNSDRGYNEKLSIEHSGHVSTGIDIDQLDLDIDTRRKILEAVKRKRAQEMNERNAEGAIEASALVKQIRE